MTAPVTPWDGVPLRADELDTLAATGAAWCNEETFARLSAMARRTDADLAAASAASFKAGVEAAAQWHDDSAERIDAVFTPVTKHARAHRAFAASIRSIPIHDASALATALEQAREAGRREEREAIALWHDGMSRAQAPGTGGTARHQHYAATIRARTPTTGGQADG